MLENLHEKLCPRVTWSKVTGRVQTIKVQLKREIMSWSLCSSTCIPEHIGLECPLYMCKNTNKTELVVDDCEGLQICLGSEVWGVAV